MIVFVYNITYVWYRFKRLVWAIENSQKGNESNPSMTLTERTVH